MTFSRRLLSAPVGLFLLTLVLRTALMLGQQSYLADDKGHGRPPGWETTRIAGHLAQGRGFAMSIDQFGYKPPTPTAWLGPLYPTIVAGVFLLGGVFNLASIVTVYCLQILLSSWTAVLLYQLGCETAGRKVGLVAAILFAGWPPAVSFPVNIIWGTTLFTALSVWLVLLLVRQARGAGLRQAVLPGLALGLTLLTEPTVALFCPLAAVWLWIRRRRRAWPDIALIAGTSTLLITPWTIRNYSVLGKLVPIKSNWGHELFIGNRPEANGFYRRSGIVARQWLDEQTNAQLAAAGEIEMCRILGRQAHDWIAQDPWRILRLTGQRFWWFWRLKFDTRWEMLIEHRRVWRWLQWGDEVTQDLLLIAAYLGAVFGLKRGADVCLPVLYLLAYPIPYYVTHVDIPRYRFPVVPMVMLLAAYTLVEAVRYVRSRRRRDAATPGVSSS